MNDGLTIVIPCYNAEKQVEGTIAAVHAFLQHHPDIRVIFVDDKSTDNTLSRLRAAVSSDTLSEQIEIVTNPVNTGKGGAVCTGLRAVRTAYVCYTDFDLAYDFKNIARMREVTRPGKIAIACRVHPESEYLIKPHFFKYIATRHIMSRGFNWCVRHLLIPHIYDVQAGLKMAFTQDLQHCADKITKFRFSFDTELLIIAHTRGMQICQTPVVYTFNSAASSVNFVRDSMSMIKDIIDMKRNVIKGRYS